MTQECMKNADFREGIRAVLVDKDNKPVWKPGDLAAITDAFIDRFFHPLGEHELHLTDDAQEAAAPSSSISA